ncbi:MAG TPA: hypothetical protein VFI25_18380 [Planctomycetota bacterium]|jgi:hypothetical protein|nr:hypothetical protein [Planctomycetota bacterium]
MTDAESLFVDTVQDLRGICLQPTPYSLLRASGLLRQLLLDSTPLIHAVNQKQRVQLWFEVSDLEAEGTKAEGIGGWRNLFPGIPGVPTQRLDLAGFLREVPLWWEGRKFTVRDVILTAANAKGGVHAGPPKDEKQAALLGLDAFLKLFGTDASINVCLQIAAVTLRAVGPLLGQVLRARQPAILGPPTPEGAPA